MGWCAAASSAFASYAPPPPLPPSHPHPHPPTRPNPISTPPQDGACQIISGHDSTLPYTLPVLPNMLFRAVLAAGDADAAGGDALELTVFSEEVAAMMMPVEPVASAAETPLFKKTQAYCGAWMTSINSVFLLKQQPGPQAGAPQLGRPDSIKSEQSALAPSDYLRTILDTFVDLVALSEFDELRSTYSTLLADDMCAKKSPDDGENCPASMPKDLIAISHKFAAEMWPVRALSLMCTYSAANGAFPSMTGPFHHPPPPSTHTRTPCSQVLHQWAIASQVAGCFDSQRSMNQVIKRQVVADLVFAVHAALLGVTDACGLATVPGAPAADETSSFYLGPLVPVTARPAPVQSSGATPQGLAATTDKPHLAAMLRVQLAQTRPVSGPPSIADELAPVELTRTYVAIVQGIEERLAIALFGSPKPVTPRAAPAFAHALVALHSDYSDSRKGQNQDARVAVGEAAAFRLGKDQHPVVLAHSVHLAKFIILSSAAAALEPPSEGSPTSPPRNLYSAALLAYGGPTAISLFSMESVSALLPRFPPQALD